MAYLQRRSNPDELPPEVLRQRRLEKQRARRRRIILRSTGAALAILGAALLVVILNFNFSWVFNREKEAAREQAAAARAPKAMRMAATDLGLAEARFDGQGKARHIVGRIRNSSHSRYQDVRVSLFLRSLFGEGLGYTTADLAAVEPAASAVFETQPVPEKAVRFEFYGIVGTAVP